MDTMDERMQWRNVVSIFRQSTKAIQRIKVCVFKIFVHVFSLSYSKSYKNLGYDYSNEAKHMYSYIVLCLNFDTSDEVHTLTFKKIK